MNARVDNIASIWTGYSNFVNSAICNAERLEKSIASLKIRVILLRLLKDFFGGVTYRKK